MIRFSWVSVEIDQVLIYVEDVRILSFNWNTTDKDQVCHGDNTKESEVIVFHIIDHQTLLPLAFNRDVDQETKLKIEGKTSEITTPVAVCQPLLATSNTNVYWDQETYVHCDCNVFCITTSAGAGIELNEIVEELFVRLISHKEEIVAVLSTIPWTYPDMIAENDTDHTCPGCNDGKDHVSVCQETTGAIPEIKDQ